MESQIYKSCSCGMTFTADKWLELSFVGLNDLNENGDKRLELRNCICGSTISVEHPEPLTAKKTGYQCNHGRAVQLIDGAAITLCHECSRDPAKVRYRPVYKVSETPDAQVARVAEDHSTDRLAMSLADSTNPHETQEKY